MVMMFTCIEREIINMKSNSQYSQLHRMVKVTSKNTELPFISYSVTAIVNMYWLMVKL